MKLSSSVQQSTAYAPALTIVKEVLDELKGEYDALRTLLLQSAVLREFDPDLLARLAGQPEDGPKLLDAITLYLPTEQSGEKVFRYDEFTRQALLEVAGRENEQRLVETAQIAADYYQEKAEKSRGAAQIRKQKLEALYYRLLANPQAGYQAWLEAWASVAGGETDLNQQSELIALIFEVWERLAEMPEAQAHILLKKGWLAYDTGNWQVAIDCFQKVLGPETRLYGQASAVSSPLLEGKANIGLGYTYLRQGAFGSAAEHFQKAARLLTKQAARDPEMAIPRARALCGLGEVCAQMGAAGDALLLGCLLPEHERRGMPVRSVSAPSMSLEYMALGRLQREAERYVADALDTLQGLDGAADDRLRLQELQARLYLDQRKWEKARSAFEQIRREELDRLAVADETAALQRRGAGLSKMPRSTERLARINMSLGDSGLLIAKSMPDKGDTTRSEADALAYYNTAWALFKQINMRDGMALAMRRKADVAALHPENRAQREEALHLYEISLRMFVEVGHSSEIARAQELLHFLSDRAQEVLAQDKATLTSSTGDPLTEKAKVPAPSDSLEAFQQAVEKVLARYRQFFRYRTARKLERRLRYIHLGVTTMAGLGLAAIFCGWPVWLTAPWLSQLSDRVSGSPWLLPFLPISFLLMVMIVAAETLPELRRLTVNLIPLRWFLLDQDRLALDDIGIHLADHTGQRKQLIRWPEVKLARSLVWKVTIPAAVETGGQTAVFGQEDQVIRFDYQLQGYEQVQEQIRHFLEKTGNPKRWQGPQPTMGATLLFTIYGLLFLANLLAIPLTFIFALIQPLQRFGPPTFGVAAILVALAAVGILVMATKEWRYMHPSGDRSAKGDTRTL